MEGDAFYHISDLSLLNCGFVCVFSCVILITQALYYEKLLVKPALLVPTVPVHVHAATPVTAPQAVFPKEDSYKS